MSEIHGDTLLAFGASCCQVSKVHQQVMSKNRTSVRVNPTPTNRCGYCGNGILLNICILDVKLSEPVSVSTPFWLRVVHIHQTTQSICLSQSGICISSRSKVHQVLAKVLALTISKSGAGCLDRLWKPVAVWQLWSLKSFQCCSPGKSI